jgi:hypothetical protein
LATRARLRQEIRRKVARIDFWFHRDRKTPHLVTNSKNDLFPFARVTFTNNQQRYIVLIENGFLTLFDKICCGSAQSRRREIAAVNAWCFA